MKKENLESVSLTNSLLPIMIGVFLVYLVIGIALPAIPLHVSNDLKMGSFMVGLVAGAQFTASLISRIWSGKHADKQGGKSAMVTGLIIAGISGMFYLLSLFISNKAVAVSVLIAGRAILGAGESFIISGGLIWGIALCGTANTGRVMAYVGTAMYLAFAIGAPLGTLAFSYFGFYGIAAATAFVPMFALVYIFPQSSKIVIQTKAANTFKVVKSVWLPGAALAFASLGFGGVTTFIILLFRQNSWEYGWLALTLFALSFVLIRLVLGSLADKIGGAKVALLFAAIEVIGLLLIGLTHEPLYAFLGAAITGIGYSLVFPALGVEAVKAAPQESKGLATGVYTAFLDLALGIANPLLGMLADRLGVHIIFTVGGLSTCITILIVIRVLNNNNRKIKD